MQEDVDELYGLALEEFTGARDALAKRLRADKRREDADALSALRKPSVAAWAINQAVRGHRPQADALLEAGSDLREAHEAMLDGGDAAAVRAASERERDAVRALTRHALDALGERASDATAEKIRVTLHAAAADEELRGQVQAGRLQRESEGGATGWPTGDGEAEVAVEVEESQSRPRRAERGGDRSSSKLPKSSAPPEPTERRSKRRPAGLSDAERRRRDAAQRAQREAERAQEAEADAEAAAQSARATLADAERASRDAREQAEQAEADERAARRAVKEAEAQAERRKTEARRAVKAAKARS